MILVLNNRDLNQVTWEQRVMEGDPRFAISQDIPDFPYARYAELLGLKGIRVDKPEQISDAWKEAFSTNRPVVLEAYTDPDVPTLPPHITFDMAMQFTSALVKGDQSALGIVKQTAKDSIESFLPHKKDE